jgi:hypothetical protein
MIKVAIVCTLFACHHETASPPTLSGHASATVASPPPIEFDDHGVCNPSPRKQLDACLAEHGFCARDVTEISATADLAVVQTHGAIDCAGNYLLARSGDTWAAIEDIYNEAHHDPRYGAFALVSIHDETAGGKRITHIDYTVETYTDQGEPDPDPEKRSLTCTWPASGWPTCL